MTLSGLALSAYLGGWFALFAGSAVCWWKQWRVWPFDTASEENNPGIILVAGALWPLLLVALGVSKLCEMRDERIRDAKAKKEHERKLAAEHDKMAFSGMGYGMGYYGPSTTSIFDDEMDAPVKHCDPRGYEVSWRRGMEATK